MAARTIKVDTFVYKEFEVIVSYKVMRNVRYRLMPDCPHIVKMSVPHVMTDEGINEVLFQIYPKLQKISQKIEASAGDLIGPPAPKLYRQWIERLEVLISFIEREMGIQGISYTAKYMKSRWGSCMPSKKSITINSALANLNDECTHYVIVHELAHIFHPNHSTAFWHTVDRYFPDYKRVRTYLRGRRLR